MEWNGMEWNGMEWNGSDGMAWRRRSWLPKSPAKLQKMSRPEPTHEPFVYIIHRLCSPSRGLKCSRIENHVPTINQLVRKGRSSTRVEEQVPALATVWPSAAFAPVFYTTTPKKPERAA